MEARGAVYLIEERDAWRVASGERLGRGKKAMKE